MLISTPIKVPIVLSSGLEPHYHAASRHETVHCRVRSAAAFADRHGWRVHRGTRRAGGGAPACHRRRSIEAAGVPAEAAPVSGTRPLLLVDDNHDDVDLTLRAFKRQPLSNPILVARDGDEVLDWMPRWEAGDTWPVVILLDIRMPRLGGFEVLAALKAHPTLRRIPVVVLTTSRARRDIEAAYAAGANSYLVKPVNFDEFVALVRQVAA